MSETLTFYLQHSKTFDLTKHLLYNYVVGKTQDKRVNLK